MEMAYQQFPMYSMPNSMMTVMPGSDNGSAQRSSQTGIPAMMATSLPNGLQQNGPFMVVPSSMMPNISIPATPRPPNTSSSISSQEKKKDSPS